MTTEDVERLTAALQEIQRLVEDEARRLRDLPGEVTVVNLRQEISAIVAAALKPPSDSVHS